MLVQSRPANETVVTSIINKRWHQVDPPTPRSRPLLINVYVNIQLTNRRYSQQGQGMEDAILHLELPIVYSIGGLPRQLLEAAATAESCDGVPVRPIM